MGGLLKHMPTTGKTFIVAAAALAGFPFITAGFYSKDEILFAASHHGHFTVLWLVGVLAAGMTAFYTTRQVILTFFGEFRGGKEMESHLHESPATMTLPLIILAVGSVVAGFVGLPPWMHLPHLIGPFLEPAMHAGMAVEAEAAHASALVEILFTVIVSAVGLASIYLAYRMYWNKPDGDKAITETRPTMHRWLYNKYYVDEFYKATVVDGTLGLSDGLSWMDGEIIDGAVNGAAKATVVSADLSNLADASLVDGAVNATWRVLAVFSNAFRRMQTGVLQNYALMMLIGIGALIGFFYYYLWT